MSRTALDKLLTSSELFLTDLRNGNGFDQKKFDALCDALKLCAKEWSDSDVIPKKAANLLVDLWAGVDACSYIYKGPGEAETIRKAADTLGTLSRECTI